MSYSMVVTYVYFAGIPYGALRPDDRAVCEIEEALRTAERAGDDLALSFIWSTLGVALVHRDTSAERDRGQKLLAEVGEVFVRRGQNLGDLPIVNMYVARERARRGDRDEAIPLMHAATDHLFREGRLLLWSIPATGVLVETLLNRGADGDVAEAEAAIERLAAAPADDRLPVRDIWLLRLRALLSPCPRRRCCLPGLGGSLPHEGRRPRLRGPHGDGRRNDVRGIVVEFDDAADVLVGRDGIVGDRDSR